MNKEQLNKWLRLSANNIIIFYCIMMLTTMMYVLLNPHLITYSEQPINHIDLESVWQASGLNTTYKAPTYYTSLELEQIKKRYTYYFFFNVLMLTGYVVSDVDKRARIKEIKNTINKWLYGEDK